MKIENYGADGRQKTVMRELLRLDADGGISAAVDRIILLPIPSARDGVHITGTDKLVSEVLMDISEGDFVVGYGISKEDAEIIVAQGADYYDAARDERFLEANAQISALGALGYILNNLDKIPADVRFGVVGYGRIGSRLCRMLMSLGAKIRVYTSNNSTRLSLGACGVSTVLVERNSGILAELDTVDVLINTAPCNFKESFPGGRVPYGLAVIELASGDNFAGVEGVVRLPSIPDRMYPASAGREYFLGIKRALSEVGG